MKVVLASQNQHKLKELQTILSHYDMEVVLQSELGIHVEVEENGTTFEENSMLKAKAVMDSCGLPTVADDSGLVVDALKGAPGVYSARYGAPSCKTDLDRTLLLLKNMEQTDLRTARFVCVITFLLPNGKAYVAKGTIEGEIAKQLCGDGGFGYDPVFFVPQEGCTLAELPEERKNQISHRANALRDLAEQLQKEQTNDYQ